MRIYEPISIVLFTLLVLTASFMIGRSVGLREGLAEHDTTPDVAQSDAANATGGEISGLEEP